MSRLRIGNCELPTADCRLPTSLSQQFLIGFPQFLIVIQLLVFLNLSAQNPFIRHYTTSDGLPSDNITHIFQDREKFIWIATGDGLTRYDGTSFKIYRQKEGLSFNRFLSIHQDSFGRIWLACSNGNMNFFFSNKFYNKTNAPFLDSLKSLRHFFQDKDGIIYFYTWLKREICALDTNNRIKKYEIPSIQVKDGTSTSEGMNILHLTKYPDGEFMIFTELGIFKTKNLSQKPVLSSAISCDIFTRCCDSILFGRGYNPKTLKDIFIKYLNGVPVDSTEVPEEADLCTHGVLEDANGFSWICTLDKGVFCLKNKHIVHHFDIKESDYIMQDHENNIWIGTRKKGVYKINPNFLTSINYDLGCFGNERISLGSYSEDGLWFTNGESIYVLKNKIISRLVLHLKSYKFDKIYGLKNHGIIIDCKYYQNFLLTGIRTDPKARKVYFNHLLELPPVACIAIDNTGKEFSAFGLIYELKNSNIITFSLKDQIKEINRTSISPLYFKLFYDANNDLVINAEKMYIRKNNEKIPSKVLSYFNGRIIYYHSILNNTTELYFTDNDSIYLNHNNKIINLTACFDYPDLLIRGVTYHEPTLYLSTGSNLYRCVNPLQVLKNKPLHLELLDINFHNLSSQVVYNDSIYIASDEGLTVIPEKLFREMKPTIPVSYFVSIMVNDSLVDFSQGKMILKGNNKIKFSFGHITYSTTPVEFSYILEGLDHEWTTGKENNVVYRNLSRGNYIFKVRARKATAEWSKPIEFKITIKAHFWQHPIFFVFLSLLFTGFIALIIIRRKNIQIKRRELDNQLISLEQKALQSMMNPHFIFNSLGSIQTYLLQNKSGEAGLYLSQFARLIRQNLNAINASSINLEEEIDRLKNYLDLEKLRMEEKFDYEIKVAEDLETDEVQIPSMIIQPFVENAIWHGISFLKQKGKIIVTFSMQDDKSLSVIVEDNGIGMKRSETFSANKEKRAHLGMELARKRLEILGRKFSIKTSLKYSELFPGDLNPGTRVELVVPIRI